MKLLLMRCLDVKVKVWQPVVAIVLFGSILTACSDSTDDPNEPGQEVVTGDDASDKASYKVVQTVVNDNGASTKTVALRYYDDMTHVAYIAVSDFQNMLVPSKSIDGGIEPHIALEVKQTTGKDDDGDEVKYSDFSAFYAPSVGEQIVNWYANKK